VNVFGVSSQTAPAATTGTANHTAKNRSGNSSNFRGNGVSTSSKFQLLLQLGRLKMTVFSAVTYSAATTLALHHTSSQLDPFKFVLGLAFMLSCQLTAHFYGE
jgi:hypothetical protein